MKVLVIGGAGFVGTHLVRHIMEDLHWDVSITKLPNEKVEIPKVNIYDLDILNIAQIEEVLNLVAPNYIVHLAALSSVKLSWDNPDLTVDINIKGVIHVLEAMQKVCRDSRILLVGSGEEYGNVSADELPLSEEASLHPGNIYAATKAAQTMIGKIYAKAYGLDIVMTRAFNHIGPGQAPIFVVSEFCRQVAEIEKELKDPIIKAGNLEAKRDFTDVRDVVRAYTGLLLKGQSGEVYNVGSGEVVSIRELLQLVLSMSSRNIDIEIDEAKFRPIDIPIIEANIEKLVACTQWKKGYSLETTIFDTLQYWRNI